MKILHIITGLNNGGAESTLLKLISNDYSNSHEVISLTSSGFHGKALETRVKVSYLGISSAWSFFFGFIRLCILIAKSNADVIQTWLYHADLIGGLAAFIMGKRNIFWGVRSPFNNKLNKPLTKIVIFSCAVVARFVPKKIIFNSEYSKISHNKIFYPKNKSSLIYNGFDLNQFKPDVVYRKIFIDKYRIDPSNCIFGMVARFDPYKDHENLLCSLHILKNANKKFVCALAGSGMSEDNTSLIAMIDRYNLKNHIILVGEIQNTSEFYCGVDFHVLSSVSESFPNVLAESMACGTPCIATNVGDSRVIISDYGWLVRPSSPEELSAALLQSQQTINNINDIKGLKKMCRNHINEHFSLDAMVNDFNNIWAGNT